MFGMRRSEIRGRDYDGGRGGSDECEILMMCINERSMSRVVRLLEVMRLT